MKIWLRLRMLSFFRRSATPPAPSPTFSEELRDLSIRLEKLESSVRSLQLEWVETHGRLLKAVDRMRKYQESATTEAPRNGGAGQLGSSASPETPEEPSAGFWSDGIALWNEARAKGVLR